MSADADTRTDAGADSATGFPICDDASASAPYFVGDADPQCNYYVDYSCAIYGTLPNDCHLSAGDCLKACTRDGGLFECLYIPTSCAHGDLVVEAGQPITLACELCPGRRPSGLRRAARVPCSSSAIGAYFAKMAYLEAASVHAFERLRDELRAYGAPMELVTLAHRSARDEVLHARIATRAARRHGCAPPPVRVRAPRARSLETVARENAVEGCIRETFGAMVATWQAAHARDEDVRHDFARIAVDETRHAALAWAVAEWADARLDVNARRRIARARHTAVGQLARGLAREIPEPRSDVAAIAGLPRAVEARTMVRAMATRLWA